MVYKEGAIVRSQRGFKGPPHKLFRNVVGRRPSTIRTISESKITGCFVSKECRNQVYRWVYKQARRGTGVRVGASELGQIGTEGLPHSRMFRAFAAVWVR